MCNKFNLVHLVIKKVSTIMEYYLEISSYLCVCVCICYMCFNVFSLCNKEWIAICNLLFEVLSPAFQTYWISVIFFYKYVFNIKLKLNWGNFFLKFNLGCSQLIINMLVKFHIKENKLTDPGTTKRNVIIVGTLANCCRHIIFKELYQWKLCYPMAWGTKDHNQSKTICFS